MNEISSKKSEELRELNDFLKHQASIARQEFLASERSSEQALGKMIAYRLVIEKVKDFSQRGENLTATIESSFLAGEKN